MARRGPRVSTEARREEILKAAYTCFSRGGYHATTIDDIALEAGLSKGAVYWHFEGKWELFLAPRWLAASRTTLSPAGAPQH